METHNTFLGSSLWNPFSSAARQGRSRPLLFTLALLAFAIAFAANPAAAGVPACPDGDSDGYVVCNGCDSTGKLCGECNDGDATISPGDPELCGTNVDENCNGQVDEGFEVIDLGLEDMGICTAGVCDIDNSVPCTDDHDCTRMCENDDFNRPMGCMAGDPGGCCRTFGRKFCSMDKLSIVCELVTTDVGPCVSGTCSGDPFTDCMNDADCELTQPIKQHQPEGATMDPASDATCFDGKDNNCDGFIDHAQMSCRTAELCDGFDNDGNGTVDDGFTFNGSAIGQACSVGQGVCQKSGTVVCDGTMAAKCSVSPGVAGNEGPPQSLSCGDGLDNDCDGFIDLADASDCTEPEKCDGLDNDNNGMIDDGFALNDPCDNGLPGQCHAEGVTVCSADGLGTTCNAVANLASTEGPTGPTCTDGLDNDCDGDVDGADADCASADLSVTCALPYTNGKPGKDCEGKHFTNFSVAGAGPNTVVTAELLALDTEGNVMAVLPDIHNGDQAQLNSRLNPSDWKWSTRKNRHTVFAPIPMFRVIAKDGANEVHAYCSNIPFLQVVQPDGNVATASESDLTKVIAAIPRDDLSTLFVKIDGVDVLAAMGIDPATDFPGGPFSDTIDINGTMVTITDLKVSGAPIGTLASNTLTMGVSGLPCGSHIFVVDAEQTPGVLLPPLGPCVDINPETLVGVCSLDNTRSCMTDEDCLQISAQCHYDDVRDKASASVFAVEITDPTDGQTTSAIPTPVAGRICHGRMIASAALNGRALDVSSQMTTPGDGEDSGDVVEYQINESVGQTNILNQAQLTGADFGTFDQGANTLYVTAVDDLGNRTSGDVNFSIGDVGTASQSLSLSASQRAQIDQVIQKTVEGQVRQALMVNGAGTLIRDAFVLGVEQTAINTFFEETCKKATQDVKNALVSAIDNLAIPNKTVSTLCDPVVHFDLKNVSVAAGDVLCNVEMGTGAMVIRVSTPAISMTATAEGHCCSGCDFICWHSVDIDVAANASITPEVNITLSESQFLALATNTTSPERTFGRFRLLASSGPDVTKDSVDIGCIVGFLADFVNFLTDAFFFIFTFGQVDNPIRIEISMAEVLEDLDLQAALGVLSFPVEVSKVRTDPGEFQTKMKKLGQEIDQVKMRPAGLTLTLSAKVSPTMTDPVVDSPTADEPDLTPAATPMPIQAGADNTYFVVSDDLLNQLFSSMTVQGEVNTICIQSKRCTDPPSKLGEPCQMNSDCDDGGPNGVCAARTFGEIFPQNCDTFAVFPKARGICEAVKGTDCETLNFALGPFVAQGACHGWKGDDCSTLVQQPLDTMGKERQTCMETPFFNLQADMPFIICGLLNNPPAIDIKDNYDFFAQMAINTPNEVETILHLNDLEMGLLIDRNKDGMTTGVTALPGCFQSGASTNGDCRLAATCLDLNFPTGLSITVDPKECVAPPASKGMPCANDAACGAEGVCRNPIMLVPSVKGVQVVVPKCSAPVGNIGNACTQNIDCDSSMGAGDGVCDTPGSDVCSGGFAIGGDEDLNLVGEAAMNNATNDLMDNVDIATPMLDTEGLDIGGTVQVDNPHVVALTTNDACSNDGACFGQPCAGNAACNTGSCTSPPLAVGRACCADSDCVTAPLGRCTAGQTGPRCVSPPKSKGKVCAGDSDCNTLECSAPPSKVGVACATNANCDVNGGDGVCGQNGVCKDECLFNEECNKVEDGKVTAAGVCTVTAPAGGACNKAASDGVCGTGERIPGFQDYLGITGDLISAGP